VAWGATQWYRTSAGFLFSGFAAPNNPWKDHDDRHQQQNVKKPAQRVRAHRSERPQRDEYKGKYWEICLEQGWHYDDQTAFTMKGSGDMPAL
jgi:hypothetical protein